MSVMPARKKLQRHKQHDGIVEIELTRGHVAIIDAADWPLVSDYAWHVSQDNKGGMYAKTSVYIGPGEWRETGMHAMLLPPRHGVTVDHKNRNGLDNRRANLRYATLSQNAMNRRLFKNNSCGVTGVHYDQNGRGRKRWRAKITVDSRTIHLGRFTTLVDAEKARKDAESKYHPALFKS